MADDSARLPDRRSDPRCAARIEVRFGKADQAARALRAFSVNFSSGGLCLKTRRAYPVGTWLQLAMTVDGQVFRLTGVVAWARKSAVGVRFEGVSDADRGRLDALAEALRKAS